MKVGDLRSSNVLLHLNINTKREPVKQVPVVYLVEPTLANFKSIASDAAQSLYDYIFVAFTKQVSEDAICAFAEEMQRNRVN
mmetsp:Transcript_28578/g.20645  ORF Transcript_28578/g.20645 Transcript_28578/m.20645 type:complete len:82 (-) Transcript_28578:1516-1761(-)